MGTRKDFGRPLFGKFVNVPEMANFFRQETWGWPVVPGTILPPLSVPETAGRPLFSSQSAKGKTPHKIIFSYFLLSARPLVILKT